MLTYWKKALRVNKKSQNPRQAEGGRTSESIRLNSSSSRDTQSRVPRPCLGSFGDLHGGDCTACLCPTATAPSPAQHVSAAWWSGEAFCVSACAHCLWSWHRALLIRALSSEHPLLRQNMTALSKLSHQRHAPLPLSSWWSYTGFCPVSPCLPSTWEPRIRHSTPSDSTVLTKLSRELPPLTCWQYFAYCSPGYHQPSLLEGHISGSYSAWCPPGCPGHFLPGCVPAGWLPACPGT